MKKFIFLLLIIPIIKYGQNNNSMKFNHQALLVNDLNQSGDFYNNILGFEEIEVGAGQNPPKRWFKSDDGEAVRNALAFLPYFLYSYITRFGDITIFYHMRYQ